MQNTGPRLPSSWDVEVDVVVVGYGFAGGVTAIEASDNGLAVLLVEKMPRPGGISITSGGGVRTATDADGAFAYLQATCAGTSPDNVLRALAEGMVQVPAYMEALGARNGAPVRTVDFPGNYPFPGLDDLGFCTFGRTPNFDQFTYYPYVRGLRGGARHFKVIEDNVTLRGLKASTATRAERLITDPDGRVVGLAARKGNDAVTIKARRGVVLACGGFEAAEDMKRQFLQLTPVLPAAFRGNTGDGIKMAQRVGAPLWHMWNIHGSYGFRHPDPDYPFGIRLARFPDWMPGRPAGEGSEMAWIVLDETGKRYMNEYPPYMQDTGHRPMEMLDPMTQRYPRIPSYMLFDEEGRKLYPLAIPSFNDAGVFYEWSADNLEEIELGIIKRADSLEDAAIQLGMSPSTVLESVSHWNDLCARGEDTDFGRPRESLRPIKTPPYYYAAVWPLVSNTQGGPVHNEHWQILDAFDQPIVGLYEAGELGGVFGHLYLAGGNLAECYVGGWTAARHLAGLEPWSA